MRVTRFATAPAPALPRRFRLPDNDRAVAPAPIEVAGAPVKPPAVQSASAREPYRYQGRAQAPTRTARRAQAAVETIRAPRMDYEPIAVVSLRVASELSMPGLFGDVMLRCDPASHDMRRLRLGTMPVLAGHNHDAPIGRVRALSHVRETDGWAITGEAEIADFRRARDVYAEMRAGARVGVSPGFVIAESEIDDDWNMTVTRTEIFEVSIVTGARNYGARVLSMEASMNGVTGEMNGTQGPEIVSTSDLTGLSLSAGRKALQTGQGTGRARVRLGAFFREFDDLRAQGVDRDTAAVRAREAAKF